MIRHVVVCDDCRLEQPGGADAVKAFYEPQKERV